MPRPCINHHASLRKTCHHCNLYVNDERWRRYWDGPDSPPAPPAIQRESFTSVSQTKPKPPCVYLGDTTGEMQECESCPGRVQLKLFKCSVHHVCTVQKPLPNIACCQSCPDYSPTATTPTPVSNRQERPENGEALISCQACGLKDVHINVNDPGGSDLVHRLRSISPTIAMAHRKRSPRCTNDKLDITLPYSYDPKMTIWSYGLTTLPSRINDLLPRTLNSLRDAGFPSPHLFVDNWDGKELLYQRFNLPTSYHQGTLQPFGRWITALWEVYIKNPKANRYALFQDDFVVVKNLRQYLEKCKYPERGYWNLYTAFGKEVKSGGNENVVKDKSRGWYEGVLVSPRERNPDLFQAGLGAVALVFSNEAVQVLLSAQSLVAKPKSVDKRIRYRKVDGGVVTAMNLAGWREYVHNPSLVQHIGIMSSCGNREHPQALTFPGVEFDALDLLK